MKKTPLYGACWKGFAEISEALIMRDDIDLTKPTKVFIFIKFRKLNIKN